MRSKTSLVAEQVRLQQWAESIRECQNRPSDMKVDTWCAEHGVTRANYYYRLKRVRKACLLACESSKNTFVELHAPNVPALDTPFTPSDGCAAKLSFPNGVSMELQNTASKDFIKNILGALSYVE